MIHLTKCYVIQLACIGYRILPSSHLLCCIMIWCITWKYIAGNFYIIPNSQYLSEITSADYNYCNSTNEHNYVSLLPHKLYLVARKFMQMGGRILANARIDKGRIHNPSPQIKPEATAGTIKPASLFFSLCHTNTAKLPTHISIAK